MLIEKILGNTKLIEIDNTWVLIYNDGEYLRLLSANSRDDAEQQIAEMLFLRDMSEPSPLSMNKWASGSARPASRNTPQSSQ
jgi:hypothetical protein